MDLGGLNLWISENSEEELVSESFDQKFMDSCRKQFGYRYHHRRVRIQEISEIILALHHPGHDLLFRFSKKVAYERVQASFQGA